MIQMRKRTLLLLICVILVSGCTETSDNAVVKQGDHVTVDYIGELEDGTVFDTSIKDVAIDAGMYNPNREYQPLGFTVGAGQTIRGFDSGVVGMVVGEEKTLRIPPQEAYGPYRETLVNTVPINVLTDAGITPVVGAKLATGQGQQGTIINVTDTDAVIDFNHRLAGETLVFKIKLVSIGPQ